MITQEMELKHFEGWLPQLQLLARTVQTHTCTESMSRHSFTQAWAHRNDTLSINLPFLECLLI